MKLAVAEPESRELRRFLSEAERVLSSEISEVEVTRAVRQVAGSRGSEAARRVLAEVTLVELDRQARARATEMDLPELRSLDAIQLASALALNLGELVFVGYDPRLQAAAASAGLTVASPGA